MSSRMDQISEHIKPSNQKNHSCDQMVKMIVNLSNKKLENNNNPTGYLNHIQKLLLLIIVDTSEKDLSNAKQ